MADVLVLSDSLSNSVEAVCHDASDGSQVPGWAETSCGKVAAVLHGLVAPGWGHILRHYGSYLVNSTSWKGCNNEKREGGGGRPVVDNSRICGREVKLKKHCGAIGESCDVDA